MTTTSNQTTGESTASRVATSDLHNAYWHYWQRFTVNKTSGSKPWIINDMLNDRAIVGRFVRKSDAMDRRRALGKQAEASFRSGTLLIVDANGNTSVMQADVPDKLVIMGSREDTRRVLLANGNYSNEIHAASSTFDYPDDGAFDPVTEQVVALDARLVKHLRNIIQRETLEAQQADVEAPDRVAVLEQNIKLAIAHLEKAYTQAPDGMLPAPVSEAKEILSALINPKRIKLSGNMIDATDRDLLGNPTLEGDAR